ncbi:hypothetical protein CGLO_14144 [Colletotrichum gloeosporioides Cg-14]|uniref:Uncharacterized protein n=1 Tax=Colletotrichum gloeosporioides (strain Cg-14) TaxID=1237896 RepID=T0LEG7_COLGC|nr:hypothetical protein CGLO_14144 [Colletotrichum gloeosporioides Cg-14]
MIGTISLISFYF